jgi:GxxExxY protein
MRSRLPEGFKEIRGQDLGERYPHKDLTERIIGCAIKVHRALKAGFVESIYENALAHELNTTGLKVAQQVTYPVFYDSVLVGEHRADMVVEDNVVIELKAVGELAPQHVAQIMSTLMAANKSVGLLMNFHEARLVDGLRRVVLERQ